MYVSYYSYLNSQDTKHSLEQQMSYYKGRIATKEIAPNVCIAGSGVVGVRRMDLYNYVSYNPNNRRLRIDDGTYASYYQTFEIPKRTGGTRTICAPTDKLKKVQTRILELLNKTKCLTHNNVHSFLPYRNCKTAMQAHQANNSRWFLKIDVHKYFDNIMMPAFICVIKQVYPFNFYTDHYLTSIFNPCFINGQQLPQGAPTSPWISNMYLMPFDYQLQQQLGDEYIITRYADDILISSRKKFGFVGVVSVVEQLLAQYNLKINQKKTRFGSCSGANWNLGLMYNKELNITVGYKKKHIFKCMIHNFKTKPPKETQERITQWHHMQGLLAYYLAIEPLYFQKYVPQLKELYSLV